MDKAYEQIKQIAERLRGLRDALDLSQKEVAERLEMPEEKYADYESGEKDIPMSFIYSVAKEFSVDMQSLISGGDTREIPYSIVRKGKGVIVERQSPYQYESLVGNFKNASGSPFMVTAEPINDGKRPSLSTHETDELDLVLEGELEVEVAGNIERLKEGDSIYFNARKPHGLKAVGQKTVRFLSIAL